MSFRFNPPATVADLRALIADLPDEMPVAIEIESVDANGAPDRWTRPVDAASVSDKSLRLRGW